MASGENVMSEASLKSQIQRDREGASRLSDRDRQRYERELKSAIKPQSFYSFSSNTQSD